MKEDKSSHDQRRVEGQTESGLKLPFYPNLNVSLKMVMETSPIMAERVWLSAGGFSNGSMEKIII